MLTMIAALRTKVRTIIEVTQRVKTSRKVVRSIKRRRKKGFATVNCQNSWSNSVIVLKNL
jgi:hypothetical protein